MNRQLAFVAKLLYLTILCSAAASTHATPRAHAPVPFDSRVQTWVVPAMRQWRGGDGTLRLTPGTRIVLQRASVETRMIAHDLARDMRSVAHLVVPVIAGTARKGDLVLSLVHDAEDPTEFYQLEIGTMVTISANSAAGLRHGTQSVLQILRRSPGGRALPHGTANDWPDQPRRAMFVDAGRKFFQVSELDDLMRQMAWMKLNTLALHFTDWPAFRLRSAHFPGLADRLSYDRSDIAHLERTARRHGIEIIPEIDLPAHANALIAYRPSLAFQCESMRVSEWLPGTAKVTPKTSAWTVDITRAENRIFLQSLLREFAPWFSSPYLHIGGDEYQFDASKNRCPELIAYAKRRGFTYTGDVFVDWINETDVFLHSLGKKTAIWSWWRFGDDKTSIEPNKDILIYAWNASRQADMLAKGYRLLVTPGDKLYVTPGLDAPDGYGVVDEAAVYEQMAFPASRRIEGYMLALWADAAESTTDRTIFGRTWQPMAIVAERAWAGAASSNLDAFLDRLNQTSSAPR